MSSSRRREQLYEERGFNKQQWQDLVDEGTELRRAVSAYSLARLPFEI